MDGGGRLSRSLGSQRPQSNPQTRAASAASRTRGRSPASARRSASHAATRYEAPHPWIAMLERRLPRFAGLAATTVILIGALVLGVTKGNHTDDVLGALSDTRNAAANAIGFRITSVAITGRKQLTQDEILAVGGVNGRSSLLFLDAASARDKLKADPWISDATVQKLYPGRLQIDITERKPFALWQENGRVSVISEDGTVLEPYVARRFVSLPLVVGKGAADKARDFLALLDRYPQVRSATKAAIYVGERRWNLRLKDGLDIRLPENDVGNALAALSKMDREDRLFSRDIVTVDMRLPDRLTVQLSEEAAKAR
ncbi:MAG: cell division protein FtsQ/DivIB, partial [Bradyrhizobium sp.]